MKQQRAQHCGIVALCLLVALCIPLDRARAQQEAIGPGFNAAPGFNPPPGGGGTDNDDDDNAPVYRVYAPLAATGNQGAIAEHLAGWRALTSDDVRAVLAILDGLPEDHVGDALDQLGPSEHDALTHGALGAGRVTLESVVLHLQDSRGGNDRGEKNRNGNDRKGGDGDNEYGQKRHRMQLMTWVAGFFASGDGGGPWIENPDSYEYNAAGFTAGADVDFLPGLVIGVEAGISETDVNWDTTESDGSIGASHGGAYGTLVIGNGFIEMAMDHAMNQYDNRRHIDLGPASRFADSEYDGSQSAAYVGAGYNFEWGNFHISPIGSVQHTHLSEDAYIEQGAGSLNLSIGERSEDSLQSVAGLLVTHRTSVGWVGVESRLRTRWTHEFATDGRELDATFTEAGGASFSATGPPGDEDRMQLGGGMTAKFVGVSAFLNFDLVFDGSHVASQMFNLGTRTRF